MRDYAMRVFKFATAIFCLMSSLAMAEGKRYAVLVGVEDYEHSQLQRLQFSVDDVTDLAAVLKQSGYAVTLLTDDTGKKLKSLEPTRVNIEKKIQTVLDQCRKDDTVILAFAGHGLQFTGQKDAYFCPVDGRPYADKSSSLVSISKIYSELEKSLAGVKVILVDACRNDPDPGRGRGGLNADAVPPPPRGVAALFSCSAGQRAFEHNTLKHGVFFHYVLEGFKSKAVDSDGEVTFSGLSLYVRKNVPRRVRKLFPDQRYDQFPNLRANLVGIPPVLARVENKVSTPAMKSRPKPTSKLQIDNVVGSKMEAKKQVEKAEAELASAEFRRTLRLAKAGIVESEFTAGHLLINGEGVDKDEKEGLKWVRKSAEGGYAHAQNYMGILYRRGLIVNQNYSTALEWYSKAASQGYVIGEYNLGFMHENGFGVKQDYAEARRWYQRAATKGYAEAQNNLGVFYEKGHGVPQDDYKAIELYRKAAAQDHLHAINNLGSFYDSGRGTKPDYNQAFMLFRKAANKGFAMSQYNMGYMYQNGRGTKKDIEKAVEWYRKAAAQGYKNAKLALKSLGR